MTNRRRSLALMSVRHNMESPKPGYAEHDAEKTWWADFCEISKSIIEKSGVAPADIVSVGCSTIGPCCLPVDKELNPLRKAILYGIDVRAVEEIAFLEEIYGKNVIFDKYGTPLTSQSAGAKVLWIKNNEPEIYARTDKFVTGSTYLVAKLTGKFTIDHYTAATWFRCITLKSRIGRMISRCFAGVTSSLIADGRMRLPVRFMKKLQKKRDLLSVRG